jgi:hypothetical protein
MTDIHRRPDWRLMSRTADVPVLWSGSGLFLWRGTFGRLSAWPHDQHLAFCAAYHLRGDRAEQPVGDAGVAECTDDDKVGCSLLGRCQQRGRRLAVGKERGGDGRALLLGRGDGRGDGRTGGRASGNLADGGTAERSDAARLCRGRAWSRRRR